MLTSTRSMGNRSQRQVLEPRHCRRYLYSPVRLDHIPTKMHRIIYYVSLTMSSSVWHLHGFLARRIPHNHSARSEDQLPTENWRRCALKSRSLVSYLPLLLPPILLNNSYEAKTFPQQKSAGICSAIKTSRFNDLSAQKDSTGE